MKQNQIKSQNIYMHALAYSDFCMYCNYSKIVE